MHCTVINSICISHYFFGFLLSGLLNSAKLWFAENAVSLAYFSNLLSCVLPFNFWNVVSAHNKNLDSVSGPVSIFILMGSCISRWYFLHFPHWCSTCDFCDINGTDMHLHAIYCRSSWAFCCLSCFIFGWQTDGTVPNTLVIANCEIVKPRVAAAEYISAVILSLYDTFISCLIVLYSSFWWFSGEAMFVHFSIF